MGAHQCYICQKNLFLTTYETGLLQVKTLFPDVSLSQEDEELGLWLVSSSFVYQEALSDFEH